MLVPDDPGNTTGCPTLASPIWVHNTTGEVLTSAPSAQDTASYTRRDTCYGYELVRSLDFNDANNDGNHDDAYDTDLDTTNGNWMPIGDFANGFTGTFDGNGNTISNLSVAITSATVAGLFGAIDEAVIRYVGLVGVSVRDNNTTGDTVYVGGLVGQNIIGTISGSYVTGSVSGANAGGLVGENIFGSISGSYVTGSVSGANAGGLVGENSGDIENSYTTGSVMGSANAGGLVGENLGGIIRNSYSIGPVNGSGNLGGLLGNNVVVDPVRESYWNIETSGQLASAGGIGQNTLQLVTPTAATGSIYELWTARSTVLPGEPLWDFGDNRQYPGLRLPLSTDDCTVDADTLLCTHRPANPFDPAASITATDPTIITEGAAATFTVTLSSAAAAGGVTVSVGVTESGSYIEGSAPMTVFIAGGATTGTLTVPTVDDAADETDGSITAELNRGIGYAVAVPPDNQAEVTVLDDDDPVASISAGPTPITEGAAADFTVTLSSAAPAGGLTISVDVTESGSYIAGLAPATVVIDAGAMSGTLTVSTDDDVVDETDGSITAVINAGTGYTVGTLSTAMVTVNDDDDPVASISAGPTPITEGASAIFRVTLSSAAPAGGLTISVDVTESGSYIAGLPPATVVIAEGATTGRLAVSTEDDSLDEPDGSITAELNAGTNYTVGTPNTALITVNDNDDPVASISVNPLTITEGADATFTVTLSSAAPVGGVTVSVGVTESDSYIAGLPPATVFIDAGAMSGTLTVSTEDDSLDESDGSITAELNAGTDYTVGTPRTAMVTVNDNDDPAASITADPPTITEGATATFTVTLSSAAPAGGLTINVMVTDSGSYIAGLPPTTVVIDAGAMSGTLTVSTEDDSLDETDGSITAVINAGTGYTVGTPRTAMVTVNDNDTPVANIAADSLTITEGTAVIFTVSLDLAAPAGGLTINVAVTESGSYIDGSAPMTVFISAGETTGTLIVSTDDDVVDETDGSITAVINAGTGYTVGTPNTAMVTVLDNDDPALVASISADPTPITEGADATFTVTLSSAAPVDGVTVSVGVTESGSYIAGSAPFEMFIAEGATTGRLAVSTEDDSLDEPDGSITAVINAGTGYTVGSPSTAMITVNDNDDPVASISAGPSPITEGADATFTVTLSSAAPAGGLTINVGVTESASYITPTAPATVVIVAGATTGTLTVSTDDDSLDETDGSITAELNAGADYTVGTPNTAMVTVNDNDDPVASISAGPLPITEGADAIFTVTLSSAAPADGLTISVTM